MKWKYHIPHVWSESRTAWEDIWLMLDDPNYAGQAFWLTINALGDSSEPEHSQQNNFQNTAAIKPGNHAYWIEDEEMYVKARDFNKEEFLDWVQIWLWEPGFPVTELVECSFAEFTYTNDHAELIAAHHHPHSH